MNKIYRFERWLDRYNHIMELLRTIIPIITLILQIFIIVNLFTMLFGFWISRKIT